MANIENIHRVVRIALELVSDHTPGVLADPTVIARRVQAEFGDDEQAARALTAVEALIAWALPPATAGETLADRIARQWLETDPPSAARRESLQIAHERGVDDATFARLCEANLVARKATVKLPLHRLEGMSRGKGWCRQGQGSSAVWGERDGAGYRVGPGRWVVGGHDGFSRKGHTDWRVEHLDVAGETWTVAF